MGRWAWSYRRTVEECWSFDAALLKELGYLDSIQVGEIVWKNGVGKETGRVGIASHLAMGPNGRDYINLIYTQTNSRSGETSKYDYQVQLTTTECNFGGLRWWMICPLTRNGVPCGRRVTKLHLPPGGKYFGCRDCHDLTYRSQKEHNKRLDFILKHPEFFLSRMKDPSISDLFLLTKAVDKLENRL